MKQTRLWYQRPAPDWNAALPVGNGRLGAMVFGGTLRERLQLNEESVWSGGFVDRNNPDCLANRPRVRELLNAGKVRQAQMLATEALTGIPDSQRCYQTLGDLFLEWTGEPGEAKNYLFELDMERALCATSFTLNGVKIRREAFASAPDDVLVLRVAADRPGALNLRVKMARDRAMDRAWAENGNTIGFDGCNGGADGIRFACMARGRAQGGTLRTIGEYLAFEGADEAVVLVAAATSFRHAEPAAACRAVLDAAARYDFPALQARHEEEYRSYFCRSQLALRGDAEAEELPTDERIARSGEKPGDYGLAALLYQYGRYLLISSSRPGNLPANLQGLWCDQLKPKWDSKYTININTEMNYWLAERGNLSECHLPLFDLMERMYPNGKRSAQIMYGARGWMAHHNTDLWGDTAPQDTYMASTFWVMGAAWLCTHIWNHYEYTGDCAFLEKYVYLMEEACRFLLDVQVQDAKERYIVSPTVSAENTYLHPSGTPTPICDGCQLDAQIARQLFEYYMKAAETLEQEGALAQEVRERAALLPQLEIGADGRLLEWLEPYEETEPGHRHISHLYALFPGHEIEPDTELGRAARKTLEYRLAHGGGHTGWSRAWIIHFWAGLRDGAKVQENIEALFARSTLPNLLGTHPPFQIDSNFAAPSGILHALMQAGENRVELLPALPPDWTEGSLTGARARGGLTLDLYWKQGQLERAVIWAERGWQGTVAFGGASRPVQLKTGERMEIRG